ncbi:MAG: hypothetical protein KF685_08265 [Acidobacteria bacterium]|nr:hypothetical protein [Acidobacteriota bacterium]
MKSPLTTLIVFAALIITTTVTPAQSRQSMQKREILQQEILTSKTPIDTVSKQRETPAAFASLSAERSGRYVSIVWNMETEKGILGYNVYRYSGGSVTTVNESLLGGSAMLYGNEPVSGQRYEVFDRQILGTDYYVVEALATSGKKILSSPVFPSTQTTRQPKDSQPQLIPGSVLTSSESNLPEEVIREMERQSGFVMSADQHQWVVSQPGVKIGVRNEGLYRVTRAELEANGFDVEGDSSLWQLYKRGVEQAINIAEDGSYIEFYGTGIDTVESDVEMYFLVTGATAGKRFTPRIVRPATSTVYRYNYDQTFSLRERTNYTNQIRNGDAENFWGRIVSGSGTTLNFTLTGVDLSRPDATVTIKFNGFSTTAHNLTLTLNGNVLNSVSSAGQTPYSTTQQIPTSFLVEGTNSLHMISSAATDTSFFDQIQISFERQFVAQDDVLNFYSLNNRSIDAKGFSSPNIRLLDMTRMDHPAEFVGLEARDVDGEYELHIPAARARKLYAIEADKVMTPFSIVGVEPANLATPQQGAEMLIIAHSSLMDEAETWAAYRSGQGTSVKIIDVDSIFNEFNYGVSSATPLKSFLSYAYSNWTTTPKYILLVGDASFDPKNYYGVGFYNMVPTRIINTIFTETGSDEFLADFNNDGLAEIAIGRIPARTGSNVTIAYNKMVNWEANLIAEPLTRGTLFAFDDPIGYDFEGMSHRVRNQLPNGTAATFVGRSHANAQANLVAAMNQGKFLVNFSGHGSTGTWAALNFFSNQNVNCTGGVQHCVNNQNNEALYTMLTCLNGFFLNYTGNSMAEALLFLPNGGAVASWASTGLTTPDIQEIMGQRFYNQIGQGNIVRLGDLIKDAKTQIPGGMDVRLSWALIGDPMLKTRQ